MGGWESAPRACSAGAALAHQSGEAPGPVACSPAGNLAYRTCYSRFGVQSPKVRYYRGWGYTLPELPLERSSPLVARQVPTVLGHLLARLVSCLGALPCPAKQHAGCSSLPNRKRPPVQVWTGCVAPRFQVSALLKLFPCLHIAA